MKKYVWSELHVEGGQPFSGVLPKPPSTTGAFQNLGSSRGFSLNETGSEPLPEFYADAAVIAFRLPENDKSMTELNPKVTSSGGKFSLGMLTDGDLATSAPSLHSSRPRMHGSSMNLKHSYNTGAYHSRRWQRGYVWLRC
jgi:hypothetical protein